MRETRFAFLILVNRDSCNRHSNEIFDVRLEWCFFIELYILKFWLKKTKSYPKKNVGKDQIDTRYKTPKISKKKSV